ncbi:MAG: transposase [Clostridia bacterium]|nr:transposase [Clostridia bacterium]MBR2397257.1 transposase [Clostridia bacterium]
MPRIAREKSENGIYHVYAQGKQTKPLTKMIDDMEELCAILYVSKERFDFDLYAFCITKNEIHLVIKEKKEMEVSLIMKFILSVYTKYYNRRYGEEGTLIHDRFRSKPVNNGEPLKAAVRYVHQLPVLLGETKRVNDYEFSSYDGYFKGNTYVEREKILSMFGQGQTALTQFKIYHAFMEFNKYQKQKRVKYTHEELQSILLKVAKISEEEIKKLKQADKLKIARQLKNSTDLSLRQIEAICHVSRAMI